ncbi:OmpA family protein [Vibrio pectenicida]|uniref:OmpA family protein n=1 Tax=Vibrio pectenicida TaxID=62763 RepID=UPI003B99EEFD
MFKSKCLLSAAIIFTFWLNVVSAAGLSIPSASVPGGYDRVTTSDGVTCESTIASSSYVQAGLMGVTEDSDYNLTTPKYSANIENKDEVGAYVQVVIPFGGGKRERLNCNRLYNIEIDRLKAEIDKLKAEANLGDIWSQASEEKSLPKVITVDETRGTALFDSDGYSLNASFTYKFNDTVFMLLDNDQLKVKVIVHTDSGLPESEEAELAEQRADSIAKYLESRGVDKSRIRVLARGNLYPIESSDTQEGRNANTRVEFIIEEL